MHLRTSLKLNWLRSLMVILSTLLGIYSCSVHAQTPLSVKYYGIEASFGSRSFQVNSNIAKINNMKAGHEGGSLGIVMGNEILKGRVGVAGFYYSDGNTRQTQELFEMSTKINFYPLALKLPNAQIQPYVSAGASFDNVKFFGKYLSDQKYTRAYEPYLGKLSQISATGAVGLEYRLPSCCDMIHLFAEAQFGTPIGLNSSNDAFANTSLSKFSSFSFGLSFGRKRY